jgi:Asp-tRNA(Asn)/Glu-tRNA(Gln) amidotransferase A subunit family amidase
MGSDTCGSIRIPAANNNLFGLRGTLGLSSRHGIIPLSHTQDIGGPLTRSVGDLAVMLDATVGYDPEDETTRASQGRVPPSYAEALRPGALKGARIGILTNLFGTVPEDEEVASVAKASLEAMKQAGAETIEVTIPGLDDLLRGSSLINSEFKFDLMDYLGRFPDAPVRSLAEILDRGEFHAALEATFRTRNAVAARETEESRRARVKRDAVRALTLSVIEEWKLDALAYPPLLRKPALVGEPQRGTNCQLSAASGLPSISMPAGFTPDGVPVGIELLGPAWTESRLLALAFAYEQAVRPRRPPAATPALVGGRPPEPRRYRVALGSVPIDAVFDVVSGRLTVTVPPTTGVRELTLNRATTGEVGPVVTRLDVAGGRSGEVALGWAEREALRTGTLYVRLVASDGQVLRGWIR